MTMAWWLVLILTSALIYVLVLLSFERQKASERKPGQEAYYNGLRSLLRGDQELAFQQFKTAVQEDSQNVDAYLRIGDLLRDRGQAQQAFSIHRDLAERSGLGAEATRAIQRALAEDHLALGHPEDAIRLLEKLADDREAPAGALRRLHRMHLQQQDFEAAYKVRQRLARLGDALDASAAALYLTLGGVRASDEGQHRRGRVLVRDALKLDPESRPAHYYLGELYARDHRPEDAVRAWKTFLEHAPELAGLIFPRLEKVLFDMGQYAEIAGIYQQVLAADPVNTDALIGLARFSAKKGDDHAAIGHLTRVLEVDPGHLVARQKLVQIHRQAGRSEEAWQAVEGFFTWLPASSAHYRCGACGFTDSEPRWYCTRCQRFDSFELGARRAASEITAGIA